MSHVSAIRFAPAAISRTSVAAPRTATWLPLVVATLVALVLVIGLGFGWIAAHDWIQHGLDHAAGVMVPAQSAFAGR